MPSIAERAESDLNLPLLEEQQQQQRGSRDGGPRNPTELTPLQCLRSPDFWMLFAINGICSGAGLTLLNNVGQQVQLDCKFSTFTSFFCSPDAESLQHVYGVA